MENTFVVYSEEYYFDKKKLSASLKKKVYNVSSSKEDSEKIKEKMIESLHKQLDVTNDNDEMLTTFDVKVIKLEGKHTKETAQTANINGDYIPEKTRYIK